MFHYILNTHRGNCSYNNLILNESFSFKNKKDVQEFVQSEESRSRFEIQKMSGGDLVCVKLDGVELCAEFHFCGEACCKFHLCCLDNSNTCELEDTCKYTHETKSTHNRNLKIKLDIDDISDEDILLYFRLTSQPKKLHLEQKLALLPQKLLLEHLLSSTCEYSTVQNLFHQSMFRCYFEILEITRVKNDGCWEYFQRFQEKLTKDRGKPPKEELLYHTPGSLEAAISICHQNFDPRLHRASTNRVHDGKGTYFARRAHYSHQNIRREDKAEVNYMFLAKVIVGRSVRGAQEMSRPPVYSGYELYDSTHNGEDGTRKCFVIYNNEQCYPMYLIQYKDLGFGR